MRNWLEAGFKPGIHRKCFALRILFALVGVVHQQDGDWSWIRWSKDQRRRKKSAPDGKGLVAPTAARKQSVPLNSRIRRPESILSESPTGMPWSCPAFEKWLMLNLKSVDRKFLSWQSIEIFICKVLKYYDLSVLILTNLTWFFWKIFMFYWLPIHWQRSYS